MALIEVVPTLEELSLVEVRGQQCMPGIETNLGELLLTAAEKTPDSVCLEVEAESYTFAQAMHTFRSLGCFHVVSRKDPLRPHSSVPLSEKLERDLCSVLSERGF